MIRSPSKPRPHAVRDVTQTFDEEPVTVPQASYEAAPPREAQSVIAIRPTATAFRGTGIRLLSGMCRWALPPNGMVTSPACWPEMEVV
jgi:hypothetical protein